MNDHSPLPKFGLLTNPVESVPRQIGGFKRLGFEYAEIGIEEPGAPPRVLRQQKNVILSVLARNHLFAIGHTAYWVGFGSSHENVREGWVREGKDMINTASALGLPLLNFHFYSRLGSVGRTERSREAFVKNFTTSMTSLSRFATEAGVELMLENVPAEEGHTLETIGYFSQVMANVPGLKFHFDVAHAFIENRMKGVEEYLDSFADRLAHIHIHDNHGKTDEHLPFGRGKIDFRKVVRLLKDRGYDGTVTFEVFTSNLDAARSRDVFRKLWQRE
jgi:sugar phosphate isomerase/epimerase